MVSLRLTPWQIQGGAISDRIRLLSYYIVVVVVKSRIMYCTIVRH